MIKNYQKDGSPEWIVARSYNAEKIKNAQIEAPGTMFVPGNLYTIKIEHDGGLRIEEDSGAVHILRAGEVELATKEPA